MSHHIRLGPPWTATATGEGITFSRKFGRPRTLDPGETVWLVIAASPAAFTVHLNGEILGQSIRDEPFEAEIAGRLLPRNELILDGARDALPEVGLRIQSGPREKP